MRSNRAKAAIILLATAVMEASELVGQDTLSRQAFEVASVKLNKSSERSHMSAVPASGRLVITGVTVKEVIQGAYSVQPFQLVTVDSPVCGFTPSGVGRIVGVGLDMPSIAALLVLRMPIVDQTGLQGRYDIDVTYTPEPFSAAALAQRGGAPMPGVDPSGPSLSDAVEEQLGLKLEPRKMPIPVVVIDHIEPLVEN